MFTGLIAAPFTPFHADGTLNLEMIEQQAAQLLEDQVTGAFICGSTGEGASLSCNERTQIAERWREVIGGNTFKLIVHVGHNSIEDSKFLAAHAQEIKADAISVFAPNYYKPVSVQCLLDFCAPVAAAAPELPFYYYEIPSMTGVHLSMRDFLVAGSKRIDNLAGIKFSHTNLMALQECLHVEGGRFNILFGSDEMLLAAIALGVKGAVGSTYNYAAPLYHKIFQAFNQGDLPTARVLQWKSVELVQSLMQFAPLAAGKELMRLIGIDCGPVRPPIQNLSSAQRGELEEQIRRLGILTTR